MKKFFTFAAVIAIAAFVSCQKQQTEAEKNAEVERQVQERLAARARTVANAKNLFMAMIRHLSFLIIQRIGVGDGVAV